MIEYSKKEQARNALNIIYGMALGNAHTDEARATLRD
jgi:hypothetical protein